MTSWKTTLSACIAAAASFVLFAQQGQYIQFPQWAMAVALFANAGGLAGLGLAAKDADVTGGTKGQPSTPDALRTANQMPSAANPPQEKKS